MSWSYVNFTVNDPVVSCFFDSGSHCTTNSLVHVPFGAITSSLVSTSSVTIISVPFSSDLSTVIIDNFASQSPKFDITVLSFIASPG